MEFLLDGIRAVTPQQCVMYVVGALLIYLAIKKDYEPSLLLPMGFGAILVNLPMSGVLNQMVAGVGESQGIIQWLFETTIEASEALPLLLFIGIGAMIDFGPLLEKPWLMLFGAAAQFGIFFTLFLAGFFFDLKDAASIAVIGAADGPTAIFVTAMLAPALLGLEQLALQLRGDDALIELPLARRADRGEHQRRPADGQRGLLHVRLAQHLHDRPLAEPCGVCQLRHAQHFRHGERRQGLLLCDPLHGKVLLCFNAGRRDTRPARAARAGSPAGRI